MAKYTRIGLTPQQLEERGRLLARLEEAGGPAREALDAFQLAAAPLMAVLEEATVFCERVGNDASEAAAERSDSWLDSAAGDYANDFENAWYQWQKRAEAVIERIKAVELLSASSFGELPVEPYHTRSRKRR